MPIALVDSRRRRIGVVVGFIVLAAVAIIVGTTAARHDGSSAKPKPTRHVATVRAPSATPHAAAARDVGQPRRLTIGSIRVNAPIIEVGTTAQGAQGVPDSIDDVGWWRDGVRPGLGGNAVIVGHTASRADGVFDNLSKVHRGDKVTVTSVHGQLTYDVTRVMDVKVGAFDRISPLVYRPAGDPGLVLMTCGDWNGKTYESTNIVFATLTGP